MYIYIMIYEKKLRKYKNKHFYLKNQSGGKDCDIRHTEDILSTTYIKDTTDFIPFEKSFLHPFRKHPVCSYSIWNMAHTQLYIPTPPESKDKLYQNQIFFIRLHKAYFKSQVKGEDEGEEFHAIMWSYTHSKWYELDNWPHNDPLLDKLYTFLNVHDVLEAKIVINNLYIFRKEYKNNPKSIYENVRTIEDLVNNNDRVPSDEVLNELERYGPNSEVVYPEEIVGMDFEEEPIRIK